MTMIEDIVGDTVDQYLTFLLNEEMFAIDVMQIKEVLEYSNVTKLPRTPDFMIGVINLRGNAIPVVDLRLKFGVPVKERTIETAIIILQIVYRDEPVILGALVDSVKEVTTFGDGELESAPKFGMNLNAAYVKAIGKKDEEFVIVLNIDNVLSHDELTYIHEADLPQGVEAVVEE